MGAGSTLPAWADELIIRRLLWTKFGVPFTGMTPSDVVRTLMLEAAMSDRQEHEGK